jgi:methionyl-tRNA synthetase
MKKFYLTTSIAYTNALPHLGFALELVQADVLARYHRILGEDVFFLTGTDEHGRKVAQAAQKAGKTPEDFTDEISSKFKELAAVFNISNSDFIRTTDQARHWPIVKYIWLKLKENGDIYKKKYHGLYCVGCEAFITKKDLLGWKCRIHQKEPEIIDEENYFFRLSRYSQKIGDILDKDKIKIIPATRKNEMLTFIKQGLEDVSFSRPRKDLSWGIPVPDDETQTIYVWADALINYFSGAPGRWPSDLHCVGKDIFKFHSLIWPGMLLSLGLSLPKAILVHGFITMAGQKMSKSLGNVIDPFELIEKYGADAVRYYLLREIPATEDGDFTVQKFEERYNADLASGLGNLVARVMTLAVKFKIQNSKFKITIQNLKLFIRKTREECDHALSEYKFNEALRAVWELISFCDKYIEKERPWATHDKDIISNLLSAVAEIAGLLQPFLPETSDNILKQLQNNESKVLFPRIKK